MTNRAKDAAVHIPSKNVRPVAREIYEYIMEEFPELKTTPRHTLRHVLEVAADCYGLGYSDGIKDK